jgi:hypothetical protein
MGFGFLTRAGDGRLEMMRGAERAVRFLFAWAFLNAVVNLRYPLEEPGLWYLTPSLDVLFLFTGYAVLGAFGRNAPASVQITLVLLLVLVRFLRVADGVEMRYLDRSFNLYFDLGLVPELFRLLYATLPLWQAALVLVLLFAAIVGLSVGLRAALSTAQNFLSVPRRAGACACASAVVLLASPFDDARFADLVFAHSFGASIAPRLAGEVRFAWGARSHVEKYEREIRHVQNVLRATPHDLAKLDAQNVLLFVIESYGRTVYDKAYFVNAMRPVYGRFEHELAQRGFTFATGLLDSPTYGGNSWLAHATLATGVRTSDQFGYKVVARSTPTTLPQIFGAAGYRTVLVQPGTTRPWPEGNFYGFDHKYFAWDFEYRGRAYGWAPMPDQFVLDFIRRRELANAKKPLFVSYALVSSHAPWAEQPVLVQNWATLGNGAVYRESDVVRFPITWPDLSNASGGYIRSVAYDFDVLTSYLRDFVDDDSLIVILGDHQPAKQVTDDSESHAVPIHVLCRRKAFVSAFIAKGFAPGMAIDKASRALPMQNFLPEFLRLFSANDAQGPS